MKRTYDVIGVGEGTAGLFACVLLAAKRLRCLWVETTPQGPGSALHADTPLLLTEVFLQELLEPALARTDPRIMRSINAERGIILRWMDNEAALPVVPAHLTSVREEARGIAKTYTTLLKSSLMKPRGYLRRLGRPATWRDSWERIVGSSLGMGAPGGGGFSRTKAFVSAMGMCALEHGKIKACLESYLRDNRGDCMHEPSARVVSHGREVLGLEAQGALFKGQSCLMEDLSGGDTPHGFYLYGHCRARLGTFPKELGDLIVVTPHQDLGHPIVVKVKRDSSDPSMTVQTRVNLEQGLTSLTETLSWATGMVVKRLSRIMPFLSAPLMNLEAVNPLGGDTVRPWFRFSGQVNPPSFFGWRSYITPYKGMYAMDRDKYACLGDDGGFFWGICIANAVLKDLGRSDLITAS